MYRNKSFNDIFDCIEKKSLVKESTFYYDYIPITTQRFSQISLLPFVENYELSDDGLCPKYCTQCNINKNCKKCKEGYNKIEKNGIIICEIKNSSKVAWIVFGVIFFILIIGLVFLFYFFLKHYKVKKQNKEIQARNKLEM